MYLHWHLHQQTLHQSNRRHHYHHRLAWYEIHKKTEMVYESFNTSGITPMLENVTPFKIQAPKTSGKRSASPEQEPFKRSKSVSEDIAQPKLFGDQSWDWFDQLFFAWNCLQAWIYLEWSLGKYVDGNMNYFILLPSRRISYICLIKYRQHWRRKKRRNK